MAGEGESKTRKTDHPCLKCGIHVPKGTSGKGQGGVQCSMCEFWVHKTCGNIDDAVYDYLLRQTKLNPGGNIFYACPSCAKFAAKFNATLSKLDARVGDVETAVQTNASDIAKTDAKLDKVETTCTKLKEDVTKLAHNTAGAEAASSAVFKEIREREDRQEVVIIHGLPEPSPAVKDKDARIAADVSSIDKLLSKVELSATDADVNVKFAKRLGARPKSVDDDPRPLRVGFKKVGSRNQVLDACFKHKDVITAQTDWEKVSVIPDLTKMQREEEKQMRNDADTKNAERTDDEAKNFEWKVTGRRGERRLIKAKPQANPVPRQTRSQRP